MLLEERSNRIRADQILFVIAIGLKPLYLRGTGVLQLSDLFFIAGFLFSVFSRMKIYYSKETGNWMLFFLICIVYQAAINIIWTFILLRNGIDSFNMNYFTLYYIFNFIVAWYCLNLYFLYGFEMLKKLLIIGMLLSGGVAFSGVFFNTSNSIRSTSFFQNPNQLGYYSVVLLTVAVYYKSFIKNWMKYLMIVVSIICLIVSLSKAALISSAIMLVITTIYNSDGAQNRNKIWKKTLFFAVAFAILYVIIFSESSFIASNRRLIEMRLRLMNLGSEKDSLLGAGRGYNRIKEIGLHLLWGVGEGAYDRFISLSGVEVHSTYGNMLVCYGIIGTFGYALIWWKALCWNAKKISRLFSFSGILLYGVTHNGIRSTLVWALLTLFFIESYQNYIDESTKDEGKSENADLRAYDKME